MQQGWGCHSPGHAHPGRDGGFQRSAALRNQIVTSHSLGIMLFLEQKAFSCWFAGVCRLGSFLTYFNNTVLPCALCTSVQCRWCCLGPFLTYFNNTVPPCALCTSVQHRHRTGAGRDGRNPSFPVLASAAPGSGRSADRASAHGSALQSVG